MVVSRLFNLRRAEVGPVSLLFFYLFLEVGSYMIGQADGDALFLDAFPRGLPRAMLKDYSGPYVPNLKYEDLSKEVLVKLLRAFSRECNVLPAYWAEEVRKRLGRDVERECLLSTWKRIGKYETGWAMEAANIKGNDVETYVKVTQLMGPLPRATTSTIST